MFSKQEYSQLKKEFWTAFGLYMKPVPFAEGEKNNWINYKTGEKHIAFRMDATNEEAFVAIEISHVGRDIQQLYFEQFLEMKTMMTVAIGEGWQWQLHTTNETGQTISRIFISIGNVNVFYSNDWPEIISFFKKHMIALDEFWSQGKYAFEGLRV